jgi:hypothetical protein
MTHTIFSQTAGRRAGPKAAPGPGVRNGGLLLLCQIYARQVLGQGWET